MLCTASVFVKTKREFPDWNGYCVLDGVEIRTAIYPYGEMD